MARRLAPVLLGLACLAAAPAGADEPLAGLLGALAPPQPPKGSVEVVGWVERSEDRFDLVVTFVPRGQVKLVADPGVIVTPHPRSGIDWSVDEPVTRIEAGQDYFAEPPTLRVPFAGHDGKPVEASVEYAYCLVDYQCLFGEATVSVPMQAPQG